MGRLGSLIEDLKKALEKKGHKLVQRGGYIGEANGIIISEEGYFGGGDCRGETSAIGYWVSKILSIMFKYIDGPTKRALSSILKCEQWWGVSNNFASLGADPTKKKQPGIFCK